MKSYYAKTLREGRPGSMQQTWGTRRNVEYMGQG